MTKYIFVTGGVVSSVGKGIVAAAMGRMLKERGLTISVQKLGPYLNVDPGTMSPYHNCGSRRHNRRHREPPISGGITSDAQWHWAKEHCLCARNLAAAYRGHRRIENKTDTTLSAWASLYRDLTRHHCGPRRLPNSRQPVRQDCTILRCTRTSRHTSYHNQGYIRSPFAARESRPWQLYRRPTAVKGQLP